MTKEKEIELYEEDMKHTRDMYEHISTEYVFDNYARYGIPFDRFVEYKSGYDFIKD